MPTLHGREQGQFSSAIVRTLLSEQAKGLSPNDIVRFKEQWAAEYEK